MEKLSGPSEKPPEPGKKNEQIESVVLYREDGSKLLEDQIGPAHPSHPDYHIYYDESEKPKEPASEEKK